MSYINKEEQIEVVVTNYAEQLKKEGRAEEAAQIERNDFSAPKVQAELMPMIAQLEEDVDLQNAVIDVLEKRKALAIQSGDVKNVEKLTRAIYGVEVGDYTNTIAAKAKKDIVDRNQKLLAETKRRTSDLEIGEIIEKYHFHQVAAGGLYWMYQPLSADTYGNRTWVSIKKDTLLAHFPQLQLYVRGGEGRPDYSAFTEFTRAMVDKERTFYTIKQTYRDTLPGELNLMNRQFALPAVDGRTDYHWFIDTVFRSVAGGDGKQLGENLQQIIWAKYLHPENIFIPAVLFNDEGSSGKGLFVSRFLMRLFSGSVADNCKIEHLTGNFNGLLAGKAVIFINETTHSKVDAEKVKSFLGSETFMVNEKYEKEYACDNTALVISASNSKAGAIPLSGENSDRRYSIFSSKTDIYEALIADMSAHEGRILTRKEAKEWIENGIDGVCGRDILHDAEQVGRWINAMVAKYGDVKSVAANHGEAYRTLVEKQRNYWLDTVETVFTEPTFTYIREKLLMQLVREFNKGEKVNGGNTFEDAVKKLIKDRGWDIELLTADISIKDSPASAKVVQRKVWKKVERDDKTGEIKQGQKSFKWDEDEYGHTDDNGRWVWSWIA